jgi:hypothetical protein
MMQLQHKPTKLPEFDVVLAISALFVQIQVAKLIGQTA